MKKHLFLMLKQGREELFSVPHPDNEYTASLPPFHSHTALLISTALPFLQPSYRQPAELIMKFLELSETMKYYRELPTPQITPINPPSGEESGIFALISHFIQDPEGLLRYKFTAPSAQITCVAGIAEFHIVPLLIPVQACVEPSYLISVSDSQL